MEEKILERGINAECIIYLNGEILKAKIVMINIHTKEVGVLLYVGNDYIEKPYRYIDFD